LEISLSIQSTGSTRRASKRTDPEKVRPQHKAGYNKSPQTWDWCEHRMLQAPGL